MDSQRKFARDFKEVSRLFPKLFYRSHKGGWLIYGDMDICGNMGSYWETFNIEIFVPDTYPFCVPKVWEKSQVIKRDYDFHIDKHGGCCLDIEHRLVIYKVTGMNIVEFVKKKVYPFFVNQVYRKRTGDYANGEYLHGFDGVAQYYREDLGILTSKLAMDIIQKILDNDLPERNELCICGEGKYKNCHCRSVEYLSRLPEARLKEDLVGFKKLVG